ncbi:hypothetical protein RRG08_043268 [Elysia crispata]|uniref:Uncharacterized protein n=1 Tax=Elysia crispata TaxID=231223 RepID=A0AAE0XXH0_9GAST|nr:hypothetical protein RRG08_043268 [Elysia crispata]
MQNLGFHNPNWAPTAQKTDAARFHAGVKNGANPTGIKTIHSAQILDQSFHREKNGDGFRAQSKPFPSACRCRFFPGETTGLRFVHH